MYINLSYVAAIRSSRRRDRRMDGDFKTQLHLLDVNFDVSSFIVRSHRSWDFCYRWKLARMRGCHNRK